MENDDLKNKTPTFGNVLLAAGLFDLDEFIGYPISVVNKYFKEKGWKMVDCFNDYKWVWTNKELNKSIVAKVDFVDDENLENEVVNLILWYDGIYSEPCC